MPSLGINEIAALSFRELQNECRKANLSTRGNTEILRKRLRDQLEPAPKRAVSRASETAADEQEPEPKRQKNGKSVADDLVCPITLELPWDPVTAEDGRVYERLAIEKHIKARQGRQVQSPITNAPMGKKLYPAPQHKNTIETLVESGVIKGELAKQWKKKIEEKEAMEELLKKAESGDGEAQERLALNYEFGWNGFVEDKKLAYTWYRKAHDLGQLYATANLGYMLNTGTGVAECNKQGNHYVGLAAGRGSAFAAIQLGLSFAYGRHGLPVDTKEAIHWLKKSLSDDLPSDRLNQTYRDWARAKLQELENQSSS